MDYWVINYIYSIEHKQTTSSLTAAYNTSGIITPLAAARIAKGNLSPVLAAVFSSILLSSLLLM